MLPQKCGEVNYKVNVSNKIQNVHVSRLLSRSDIAAIIPPIVEVSETRANHQDNSKDSNENDILVSFFKCR